MNMFFFISLFSVVCAYESPQEFPIDVIAFFPEFIPPEAPPFVTFASLISNAFRLAVEMINNRTCGLPDILPSTNLVIREHSDRLSGVGGLEEFLKLAIRGESLVLGVVEDVISIPASIVGNVYDVAILSPYSPSSRLGDKSQFPFFSRIFISATQEVDLLQKQLLYFSEIGGRGWTDVAVLANIQDSNIDFAFSFIRATEGNALNIVSYQQIFVEQENLEIEFNEILKSGARVIVTSILVDLNYVMEQAEAFGLVGEHYVWCSSSSSELSLEPAPQLQGLLVSTMQADITTANYECFTNEIMANPATASPLSPGLYVDNMDTILAAAYAIRALDDMEMLDGRRISAQMWSDVIRSVSFEGTAGQVSFLPNGDRDANLEMNYYNFGGNDETTSGLVKFSVLSGDELTQVADVVWYSNSTELPDLDIRPAFHYWSCKDGERGFDETGKTISIHSPDESNVDEIDSDYHCDAFIDCQNFSDERYDCSTNYLILFIVFGIITFLLMFVVILIFLVVIIFGFILKYPRVKARSPSFLLILLISIFVGYSSIFAYFGKPHPVSCAFQPWLLGLPSVSMIAVLSVKNLRVYRIFSSPLKKVSVSDKKLFVWWLILVLPSLLIVVLWMIISTPSADFVERDGRNHYVCVTGGFTGYPGGYVFFSILVAYTAIILIFGGIISVLSRNIHPLFNESKLLTISIYNLGFLAVVIIPVFLVVQPYNPFIAWILRSCAVLYAFTTTLVVQFAPMTFSILVRDQMKSVPLAVTKTSQTDGPISG